MMNVTQLMEELEEHPEMREKRIKQRKTSLVRPALIKFVSAFEKWLGSDDPSRFGKHRHILTTSTVTSMVSNFKCVCIWLEVKHFFMFILRLILLPLQHNTKKDMDGVQLIAYLLNVVHAKEYINYLLRAGYTIQTVRNHLVALLRMGHFMKAQAQGGQLKKLGSEKTVLGHVRSFMQWGKAQLAFVRKKATRETITRNCREVYEAENRWVGFDELIMVRMLLNFCCSLQNTAQPFKKNKGRERDGILCFK
jgi:hypothetical protein